MSGDLVTAVVERGSAGASSSPETGSALSVRIEPWSESAWTEWRGLERKVDDVPLAATSSWTAAWLHAYGDDVDARVAIAEQAGRTRGMALLVRRRQRVGPWRLSTMHLGTAGEADEDSACVEYNGLLVEESARHDFMRRLAEQATEDRAIDEVRLDGFDETIAGELLGELPGAEVTSRVSRYFNLAKAREHNQSVMDCLGSSTRSALRRALRKTGDINFVFANSLHEADDFFSELVDLHQARWRSVGQKGAFASQRFLAFQRELVTRLQPEEQVVLARARSRERTIGCLMLLVDRGRLLDYLSGFAAFDETPSPGIVTHYLAMERALEQGYQAYDFLVGDKRHKANLATDSQNLVWATWRRPCWKNRAIAGLRSLKRSMTGVRPSTNADGEGER